MNYSEYCKQFYQNYHDVLNSIIQLQEQLSKPGKMIDLLEIKKSIGKLDNEFIERFGNSGANVSQTINSIPEFKNTSEGISFSNDFNEKLSFLKNSIKNVKLDYMVKYNLIVERVNERINKLKNIDTASPQIIARIQKLVELKHYDLTDDALKKFAFNNKMKALVHYKVIKTIQEIDDINNAIGDRFNFGDDVLYFDGDLSTLEDSIGNLYNEIRSVDTIVSKNERKHFDLEIKMLEDKLDLSKKTLLSPEKAKSVSYDAIKSKIDRIEDKLVNTSIMYRSKCPLLVKKVKSAQIVYKKNEKLPLLALGISSLSLVDFVVGPVIIPSIMCGNMKLAQKYPKFSKITNKINGVLAKVIDAKKYENGYKLRTGVELNEESASASVLKSIAVQEGKEWIAPLVLSARNLFEKMKLSRLKQSISRGIGNVSNKVKTGASNIKNSAANNVKVKDTLIEISKLFKEFQQSKLSMDEFCQNNNISADDRIMLETFNKRVMG